MRRTWMIAALWVCASVATAWGQPKPAEPIPQTPAPDAAPAASSDFALTIYSSADPADFDPQTYLLGNGNGNGNGDTPFPGYGVVRESRKIDLQAGVNDIKFTDVAAGIDPTTVSFRSRTAPDTTSVLEQNFEFDLTNPDKLLEKYLDKEIIINRKQQPLADDKTRQPETIQGKLLSFDANTFVLQSNNKQLPVQIIPRSADIQEIKLFDLQTGLITKPTLVWKVNTDTAGTHDAQVTYQTTGITWRADYSFFVNKDDSAVDVAAWVSILNQSGASYPNAKIKLVAGDVHRVERQPQPDQGGSSLFGGAGGAEAFSEKPFLDYHLYTLSSPTSLANNSTKQIELFPRKQNVPVAKVYVYNGMPIPEYYWRDYETNPDRDLRIPMNPQVDVYLKLRNSEKDHLGLPLPAGRVRVYKQDEADGLEEFAGEDLIPHTPKDEDVLVRLGSAFDIVGQRKQMDLVTMPHDAVETIEIRVRNHKKDAVKVRVRENMYRYVGWEITKKSDDFEKIDSRTIEFPIDIPADGEKVVTYTVHYTW